jgi:hypothetical protein
LRVKSQEFIFGDIEERSIEVGGVFREIVTSLDMKLGTEGQWLITMKACNGDTILFLHVRGQGGTRRLNGIFLWV